MKLGKASSLRIDARSASAELLLYDVIGGGIFGGGITSAAVAKALQDAKDVKTLTVRINSPGGDVFEGVAIYNAIKRHPAHKVVHVDGLAASMASYIACAGDRIVTAKNAQWMIHEPSVQGASGTVEELTSYAERLTSMRQTMIEGYAARTRQAPENIAAWMAAETWMTAEEALARGFTDEIEGEVRMAAMADPGAAALLAQYRHTPEPVRAAQRAKEPVMEMLFAALALAKDSTEAQALAAVTALKDARAAILALSGKTTDAEALGVVTRWKAEAEKAASLAAKVAELETAKLTAERDSLIESGKKDGKLPPALEGWAKTQGVESLKAFLSAAPTVAVDPKREPAKADATTGLTDEESKYCAKFGVDPKAYAAHKQALKERHAAA